MANLTLLTPTTDYEAEYREMLADWQHSQDSIPWYIDVGSSTFTEHVAKLEGYSRGLGITEGYVENATYWLSDISTRRIIGAINIRLRLNEYCRNFAGQIGYAVRPSERRKGYAKEMLHLGLIEARRMGLNRVLICCYKDNIGSVLAITGNGGVLDSEGVHEGKVFHRYWIDDVWPR